MSLLEDMVCTLANSVVHMGSTSSSFAALISVWSLSAYVAQSALKKAKRLPGHWGFFARMADTYSDVDVFIGKDESGIRCGELGVRHGDCRWCWLGDDVVDDWNVRRRMEFQCLVQFCEIKGRARAPFACLGALLAVLTTNEDGAA